MHVVRPSVRSVASAMSMRWYVLIGLRFSERTQKYMLKSWTLCTELQVNRAMLQNQT